MKYYVDGYTLDKNPSPIGGGFTIVDENNKLIIRCPQIKVGYTNNEAELLGCLFALRMTKKGDTIFVDSKNTISWVTNPLRKKRARKDLDSKKLECKRLVEDKKINLVWIPRDENLAGIYNEEACG